MGPSPSHSAVVFAGTFSWCNSFFVFFLLGTVDGTGYVQVGNVRSLLCLDKNLRGSSYRVLYASVVLRTVCSSGSSRESRMTCAAVLLFLANQVELNNCFGKRFQTSICHRHFQHGSANSIGSTFDMTPSRHDTI